MDIFDSLKQKLTNLVSPIVEGLKSSLNLNPTAPKSPSIPVVKPPVSQTPITDALTARLPQIAPTQFAGSSTPSFQSSYADEAAARSAALVATARKNNPFLANVLDTGGDIVKKGAAAADTFINTQTKNVADFASGKLSISPADVLTGLKDTGIGTLKLTGSLAQGITQGILRIGTSAADLTLPGYEAQRKATQGAPGVGATMNFLTGAPTLDTYQDVFKGANDWALTKGATPNGAKGFAGFAVLGSLFMDNPIGFEGKAGITLGKDAIEQLAKTSGEDEVKTIIKAANPKMTDKVADFITPLFAQANTPEDVNGVLKFVNGAAKTAETGAAKKVITEQAKEATPFVQPAREADSFDEFLQNVGTHSAVPSDVPGITNLAKEDLAGAERSAISPNANIAEVHPSDGDVFHVDEAGKVGNITAPENLKPIIEQVAAREAKGAGDVVAADVLKNPDVVAAAKRLGYDGFRGSVEHPELGQIEQTQLFNRSRLYTKDDLQRVYDNARSGTSISTAPISPNLIKSLGEAKNPYEVLNIVKSQFPNLPDRVVDRIVQRFTHTKRIPNVENLISAARNLDERFKSGTIGTVERVAKTAEEDAKIGTAGLPKKSAETLARSEPASIRKLMRQDQKIAYIKAIKSRFDDPKEAVAAQHEYDRIWDDLNQHVVSQYDELGMQKSFLEDTLANDNAAQLFDRYYKRGKLDPTDPTQSLEELMHNAQGKAKKNRMFETGRSARKSAIKLSKLEEHARGLDTEIEYLGYPDFEEAQAAVERYAKMRQEVKDLGGQLKELKPRVREARLLQNGLDDIAVVPREDVQAIDKLITPANLRDEFKDISGFAGQARDLTRNFEKFFGKKYADVKKAVLDPFDEAKGRFVDTNKKLADELDQDVAKKFGFRRGSPESAAIQRFGDTDLPEGERMSKEDLVKKFGKEKADNIIEADKFFRKQYDTLIDQLNEVRKKIYPNTPSKLIGKRSNYYRHFGDMADTWGDALREFFEAPSGIDPHLVGTSEFTKAKSRFLSFAQARVGQTTKLDAIGGFLDYIPAFAYAKEIDPKVSAFRYLRSKLADAAEKAGFKVQLLNKTEQVLPSILGKDQPRNIEGMLGFLDDFARDLTGNTNPVDRYVQRVIGRKNLRVARYVNKRMKENTVVGNLGSAIAQIANVPQGIADTKLYAIPGLKRSLGSLLAHNEPMDKSIFLKERYAGRLADRFPLQFKDHPVQATTDEVKKVAGWAMEKVDEIGTKFIWNSEYEKAKGLVKKGKDIDPIKYADDRTRKMVAGRGIGEVPLAQKAVMSQFAIPFTLEVGNAWWVMKDWVGEKDATALATFFLANYVLNEAAERTRGSRITFDPINATIQGAAQLSSEWKDGHYGRGIVKLLGREAGEILANIPGGQQLAAITPDSAVQGITQKITGAPMDKQEIFGDSQVSGRFGTPLIVSGLQDAVYRLLPPVGGLQLKKTYDGLKALIKGSASDSSGNPTFDVKPTAANVARALAFGSSATSEAQQYFNDRSDLFSRIDRQSSEQFIQSAQAEGDWAKMKKMIAAGDNKGAAQYLTGIAEKDPAQAKAIAAAASADQKGLTGNDRLVSMLNVSNGERAKYISDQLSKMSSGKDKAAYLSDLADKKLLTKQVVAQLTLLLNASKK